MSANDPKKERGGEFRASNAVLGLVLILLGVALLAANLGWLNWFMIRRLLELWPLALVVLGLGMVLHRQPWLWLLLSLLLIAAAVAYQLLGVPGPSFRSYSAQPRLSHKYGWQRPGYGLETAGGYLRSRREPGAGGSL